MDQHHDQSKSLVRSTDADLWTTGDMPSRANTGPSPARRIQTLLRGRYHWAILLGLILGTAFGLLGYFGPKTTYTAVGKLEIRPTTDSPMGHSPYSNIPPMFNDWLQTQMNKFTTPDVVNSALASDTWTKANPPVTITPDKFVNNLTIDRPQGGYLIWVEYTNRKPKVAAAGVNAIMRAFETFYRDHTDQKQAQMIQLLEQRQSSLMQKRQSLQQQKQTLAQSVDVGSVEQRYQFQSKRIENVEQQLTQIRQQIADIQAQQKAGQQNVSIAELATRDPHMEQLFQRKDRIVADMEAKKALGIGENNLTMIRDRVMLQHINQQIQNYANAVRSGQIVPSANGNSAVSLDQLKKEETASEKLHTQLKASIHKLVLLMQRTQNLDSQINLVNNELDATDQKLEEDKVENEVNDRVQVNNYASVPDKPSNLGKRHKLAAVGGLGGLSLGFGFVILIGLFDRRLRHAEDTQGSDLPNRRMLGVLPTLPENLGDPEQAEVAALSVHHIRTLLQLRKTEANRGRVFSVTSPSAGSGKSSLTVALGLSFATSHAKTLIIDCDIVGAGLTRRLDAIATPSLKSTLVEHKLITDTQAVSIEQERRHDESFADAALRLDLLSQNQIDGAEHDRRQNAVGILEACNGHALEDCIVPAGIEQLYVLPVGVAQPHHAGELSPAALRKLVEKARQQFDTVIIDTGPVLGSIEASMAAVEADGVIFIVSRGDQKTLARRSLEALDSIDAHIAGIVFNHALSRDIERSSYTSATVSRSRASTSRTRRGVPYPSLDPDASGRLGPLGLAVASYGTYASSTADDID